MLSTKSQPGVGGFFASNKFRSQNKHGLFNQIIMANVPTSLTRNFEAELYIPKEEISNQQMLVALR